ncbi:hypothetical protein J6590_027445, partial [Homalodisca vitripennis]
MSHTYSEHVVTTSLCIEPSVSTAKKCDLYLCRVWMSRSKWIHRSSLMQRMTNREGGNHLVLKA